MKLPNHFKVKIQKDMKNNKPLLQQYENLNEIDTTDNADLFEKVIQQNDDFLLAGLSLIETLFAVEESTDIENNIYQLQTVHGTYPSVIRQSFFDPSFFNYTS